MAVFTSQFQSATAPTVIALPMYQATKRAVDNRGVPPDVFLRELVEWGKSAPDEIFAFHSGVKGRTDPDIFALMYPILGPWRDLRHRRAAMLEVLRVLAGFESSWRWTCGVDTTNRHSLTHIEGEETGIFQVSFDSIGFDASLRDCVAHYCDNMVSAARFIIETKTNHAFALEYCARLLRFSYNWDGPIKRGELSRWVSKDAVDEFISLL